MDVRHEAPPEDVAEKQKLAADMFWRPPRGRKGKAPIGPLMIGFFLFVVVGSSVLQIVQMAGMGGRIAQQMENQQPRAEPQPRPRKKKPTPAADP